ncbi:MAG: hypothetical protein ACI4RA_11745, partial [Kiritimatiellia bacterium]
GAGGGGGVRYLPANGGQNWSSHGRGGSNAGGNGADVTAKIPATAGLANTGSGGGGGSVDSETGDGNSSLWKGGDGADGVVIVSYVMRGNRDLEPTPIVELKNVGYDPMTWIQTFDYRVAWSGEKGTGDQQGKCKLYLLYGTTEAEVRGLSADDVEHRKVLLDTYSALGLGSVQREALVTATNWYVRLVAEAPNGKRALSPEVLPLNIPGLNLDGAKWVPGAGTVLENGKIALDYRFHWPRMKKDTVNLTMRWSENEADLEGDLSKSKTYDLGTGRVLDGDSQGVLEIAYFEPLERGKTYYVRLEATDADGARVVLSPEIRPFEIPNVKFKLYLGDISVTGVNVTGATPEGTEYTEGSLVTVTAAVPEKYHVSGWKMAATKEGLASAEMIVASLGRTQYSFLMPSEDQWIVPVVEQTVYPLLLRGVQRYPWKNLVDIDYNLGGDYSGNGYWLRFYVTIDGGEAKELTKFLDPKTLKTVDLNGQFCGKGWHRVTWDANADGVAQFSQNVKYSLQYYDFNEGKWLESKWSPTGVMDTRRGAVRIVNKFADDLLPFTYSAANWVVYPYESVGSDVKVSITLTPVATTAAVGTWWNGTSDTATDEDASDGTYDYADNQASMTDVASAVSFFEGNDVEGRWEWGDRRAYGLVKAVHTIDDGKTAQSMTAYFRFPELTFQVLQRSPVAKEYKFIVNDTFLKDRLNHSRVDISEMQREEVRNRLNARQPNHLRLWETLVTGTYADRMKPYTMNVAPESVTGAAQPAAAISVGMPPATQDQQYGYYVQYELRKAEDGAWNPQGARKDTANEAFDIALTSADAASGLYRVYTLIIPFDNAAIVNEIPATNIVGVLGVVSKSANTMAAVPWRALASDPVLATDVKVANYLKTAGLDAGDSILALAANGQTYEGWTLEADHTWKPVTTVSVDGVTVASGAEVQTLPRGDAVWVRRAKPVDDQGNPRPFWIYGQFEIDNPVTHIDDGKADAPSFTMLGRPGLRPLELNKDIDWQFFPVERGAIEGNFGDVIVVPEALVGNVPMGRLVLTWERVADETPKDGTPKDEKLKWGYWHTYREGRLMKSKFETDIHVPPGRAFWYTRRGTGFNVPWALKWPEVNGPEANGSESDGK